MNFLLRIIIKNILIMLSIKAKKVKLMNKKEVNKKYVIKLRLINDSLYKK